MPLRAEDKRVQPEAAAPKATEGAFKRTVLRPVRFLRRHWRAFVKALVIVLALVVCWLPAIVINNMMGYIPGVMATLAVVVSGLYLLLLQHFLDHAQASRIAECVRGERVDFVVRLKNRSVLLFPRVEVVLYQSDLFGGEGRSSSHDIMLLPFASRDFTFSMSFDHVGVYQAGLKRVVVHDLIGLFSKVYENDEPQNVDVLPRRHELEEIVFSSDTPTQSTRALKTILNEDVDYSQVREYRWGDPIKAIHWKLSARLEYFVTRIYESNSNPGLTTVVDLCAPAGADASTLMQLFDGVVEAALSVDDYARRQGLEATLSYMDDVGDTRRYSGRLEEEGMRSISRLLREDTSAYAGNAYIVLRDELNSPYAQSNIALCTCALDDNLIEMLLAIKQRRKNPLLFYVVPEHLEGERKQEMLAPLRRLDDAHIAYCAFAHVEELAPGGGAQWK